MSTVSDKAAESTSPRERHPAVWNAAYGAAFANALSITPIYPSERARQRICKTACGVADMAVLALEAQNR